MVYLKRMLREALWAPAAVLVLNAVVTRSAYARDLYWLLHLLGGAALGFFFLKTIRIGKAWIGELRPAARYVVAFALACSTALGWELAEFAIDQAAGTRLQEDLAETMSDLMLGVCGAALYLAFAAFTERSEG